MHTVARPNPIDMTIECILSDTSPVTDEDMADVKACETAIRKGRWRVECADILRAEPFCWTEEQAYDYARDIADGYLERDIEPEEAIQEEQNYWD